MKFVLHGMIAIGMTGVALAEPAGRPVAPALSRLADLSDGMGSQGSGIYRACPAGPRPGDAPWRGCPRGTGKADHGPGVPIAPSR